MVRLELSVEDGRLVLRFTADDDAVELSMTGDEARQLVNNVGEAISHLPRTEVILRD